MTQEEAKNYVATQVYDNNNKEVKAGNVRNSVNKAIDYTKEIEDKVATIGADNFHLAGYNVDDEEVL